MPPPQDPYSFWGGPLPATEAVLRCFAISIIAWLVIGALGFSNWSPPAERYLLDMLVGVLVVTHAMSLTSAVEPAGALWPQSSSVYTTAAILGFGATTICTILLSGFSRDAYLGIFWSLSGSYLGIMVEGLTCVVHRTKALVASTAEAQLDTRGTAVKGN